MRTMSGTDSRAPARSGRVRRGDRPGALRVGVAAAVIAAVLASAPALLAFVRNEDANRLVVVSVAIGMGVVGVFFLFWAMNELVDLLPARAREHVRPYVFIGPAVGLLAVFLVYPVLTTFWLSLRDARGQGYVGLDNYGFVFSDTSMRRALRNTAGWTVVVPLVAVVVGLGFATLADRLRHGESLAKSLIFLPMAISFVGAAVTFRLIYSYRPEGYGTNIGLLNGIWQAAGNEPQPWLSKQPVNNVLLMLIMVWMQTGFAMVVLSAAIKAIPAELIEAARIDGATELQVFRYITVPTILPTIVVVTTYMVINALKVFDIVFVMGNAESNGTEVVAERMIAWYFIRDHDGRAAAIAVVLFLAVVPVMVWNVRKFRQQEALR